MQLHTTLCNIVQPCYYMQLRIVAYKLAVMDFFKSCYTSDLKEAINSNLVMFADDKNVVISDKDPNNLIRKANDELENISQYMTANQLIINKSKTSYLT